MCRPPPALWILGLAAPLAGCLPYAVGSTAETTPPGEVHASQTSYVVPGGYAMRSGYGDSLVYGQTFGTDPEVRFGIDERSDAGLRLVGPGVAATYKRRLAGDAGRAAVAGEVGVGFVNAGLHGLGMASVIASAKPGEATPYGGLRLLATLPLQPDAVRDTPSVGAFGGLRIGQADFGVSVEVGLFYDRAAAPGNERPSSFVVVPSVTAHGERLMRILWGWI